MPGVGIQAIDNSIDALTYALDIGEFELSDEDLCIEVYLPESENDMNAIVEVKDRAPGMDAEKLQQAVRAGWSGNDQFDKLGLFGMGFNVATARLRKITRVITSQSSGPNWIGVEIDLDNIGEDFEAKDLKHQNTISQDTHRPVSRVSLLFSSISLLNLPKWDISTCSHNGRMLE